MPHIALKLFAASLKSSNFVLKTKTIKKRFRAENASVFFFAWLRVSRVGGQFGSVQHSSDRIGSVFGSAWFSSVCDRCLFYLLPPNKSTHFDQMRFENIFARQVQSGRVKLSNLTRSQQLHDSKTISKPMLNL